MRPPPATLSFFLPAHPTDSRKSALEARTPPRFMRRIMCIYKKDQRRLVSIKIHDSAYSTMQDIAHPFPRATATTARACSSDPPFALPIRQIDFRKTVYYYYYWGGS